MRVLAIWTLPGLLLLLSFGVICSGILGGDDVPEAVAFETHNYDRLDEVQKACSSITANAISVKLPIIKLIGLRMSYLFIMGTGSIKEIVHLCCHLMIEHLCMHLVRVMTFITPLNTRFLKHITWLSSWKRDSFTFVGSLLISCFDPIYVVNYKLFLISHEMWTLNAH